MTATYSVHSNALNFMSSVQNGIDPRTGLYSISINLPDIQTNDLRGPGFAFGLGYSALNPRDSGYGHGWNLQLSQYTPGNQILSLSTGETFKVTGSDSATGQLTMKEKKLDSFHFYQEGNERYRVVHKSGTVEILEVRGNTQNRVALPIEIHAITGHTIRLDYVPFSGSDMVLNSIKDDSGNTLLSFKRESSTIEVLLQPFAGPDGGPLARFLMTLGSASKYVEKITLPTENDASWRFGYIIKNNQVCISSVETPTGGREEIYYQDLGHQFPRSVQRDPLPRVTDHRIFPGLEQPMVRIDYTYPDEYNFLGFGLSVEWKDDGMDNLYKYTGNYEYRCVETLWVTDEPTGPVPNPIPRAVRKIERKYNRFHLLTHEITTQNNNVQSVETTYNLIENESYEIQPRYFQLPKEVKTSWSLLDNASRYRSESVRSTYDEHGNLLRQVQVYGESEGEVETNTWYPAADANDFVRHLKERTTTPVPLPNDKAPTLRTRYTYRSLPALAGSSFPDWLTLESLTELQVDAGGGETVLKRTVYEHINQPDNAFLHARVARQAVTLNKKSTFIDYQYRQFHNPELGVDVQETTETLSTDFDGSSATTSRQHSLLTSQELWTRTNDMEVRYTYDILNRLTSEVVAGGTPNEARRSYEYVLSGTAGQHAEQIFINAKNIRTRSVLDGLGRAVFEERDHVDSDNPGRARQIAKAVYDSWGNLVEQTVYDWLDDKELALTTRFEYDNWAQLCTTITPNGVEQHKVIDPIGTPDSGGPVVRSWVQSQGPAPCVIGLNETWLNRFGKPSRARVMDATGKDISVQTFQYDGLGRCIAQTDPYDRITRFTYDSFSRVISSRLPDTTVVEHDYATHSVSLLPTALRVIGNGVTHLVGEQEFDGLLRLTRLSTGQRTERYAYEGGQTRVSRKTTPTNQIITYDYDLSLTDQPVASHAPEGTSDFTYDSTSARLIHSQNAQGARHYDYTADNKVQAEHWVDKIDKTWTTLYTSSMQGRLLKRTDVKSADSEGLDTVNHYDELGRVTSVEQGQLESSFEYDRLGQVVRTTTRDKAANSVLMTELKFDDQGREILRTLTLDAQPARTLTQTWRIDGLLESRHMEQGTTSLLKETFGYDLRGRLTDHVCSGSNLPQNDQGRKIVKQIFTFDALDNITLTMTYFPDDNFERARFSYATDDPCLLEAITYTPPRGSGDPTFSYDPNGNQLNDERGQRLSYDSQNRLLHVESVTGQVVSQYRYDSHDHLINSQQGGDSETLRFYQDDQLSAQVQDDRATHLLLVAGQPLGQQDASDSTQTLLLQTDANHSVIGESQQRNLRTAVYSAYGERHSDDGLLSLLAFNGELRDQANGWYLLGRGYRAYNPGLMRFHSPDSLSPFGSGGVNPYTYCLGNPIAMRDPTGHEAIGFSGRLRRPDEDRVSGIPNGGSGGGIEGWIGVVIGAVFVVVGAVSFVTSFGTAAPLSLALLGLGTALSAASTVSGAVAVATGDKTAAKISLWTGVAGAVVTAPALIQNAYKGITAAVTAKTLVTTADDLPSPWTLKIKPTSSSIDSLTNKLTEIRPSTRQMSFPQVEVDDVYDQFGSIGKIRRHSAPAILDSTAINMAPPSPPSTPTPTPTVNTRHPIAVPEQPTELGIVFKIMAGKPIVNAPIKVAREALSIDPSTFPFRGVRE